MLRADKGTLPAMNRLQFALPVLVLATVSGCSSDNSEGPSQKIEELVDQVGCTGFKQESQQPQLPRESGSCSLAGNTVHVHVFDDSDDRDRWMSGAGSGSGHFVYGDGWVVEVRDQDLALKISGRTNGDLDILDRPVWLPVA
jgi:hypothetical protein